MMIASGIGIGTTNSSFVSAGGAFSPLDLTPTLWISASDINQADNTAVSTWSDLSGNGNDFTQGTAGLQPTLKTNQINGQSAVYFDGTEKMSIPSSTATFKFLHDDKGTIFVVGNFSNTTTGVILDNNEGSSTTYGIFFSWADNDTTFNTRFQIYSSAGANTNNNVPANFPWEKNEYHYAICKLDTRNVTASERSTLIADDGTTFNNNTVSNSHVSSSDASYDLSMGSRSNTSTLPLTGYIAEIVIFNYLLDAAQITQMTDYIDNKYGVL